MNGVHLGKTLLGYNYFHTDTVIEPGRLDETVALIIGDGPSSTFCVDGESVHCTARGAVLSPPRRVVIHRSGGSGIMIIKASRDTLEARIRETIGRPLKERLTFDSGVDLANGAGAQARRMFQFYADEFHQNRSILKYPLSRAAVDDVFLSTLLSLPSNYSDELGRDQQQYVAPGIVRLAEEFIEANASMPIRISQVLKQSGCTRSSLYRAFRQFRGYSPMEFLGECRLKSARSALQDPSSSETVTSIALSFGFTHLSRFSQAYFRRFGEKPSETLRKARWQR